MSSRSRQSGTTREVSEIFYEYLLAEIARIPERVGAESPRASSHEVNVTSTLGRNLAERLTMTLAPFKDPKDAVKYICKDLWYYVFKQQASRLQANKRGVFVIHDLSFPPLQALAKCCLLDQSIVSSSNTGPLAHPSLVAVGSPVTPQENADNQSRSLMLPPAVAKRAEAHIAPTAEMIRSFLKAVGFECSVEASLSGALPSCSFTILLSQTRSDVLDPSRLLSSVASHDRASI